MTTLTRMDVDRLCKSIGYKGFKTYLKESPNYKHRSVKALEEQPTCCRCGAQALYAWLNEFSTAALTSLSTEYFSTYCMNCWSKMQKAGFRSRGADGKTIARPSKNPKDITRDHVKAMAAAMHKDKSIPGNKRLNERNLEIILARWGYLSLSDYEASDFWKKKMKSLPSAPELCQRCSSFPATHVHFRHYTEDFLFRGETDGTVFICNRCFEEVHPADRKLNLKQTDLVFRYAK